MGRKAKDLSALAVTKLSTAGLHFVGHVTGLALNVSATGTKSWILRISIGGKRSDMGLGRFPEVPLALAKQKATEMRQQVDKGLNPIATRLAAKAALRAQQASFISFKEAAERYIEAHKSSWKNPKHIAQWHSTLKAYAYPVIGNLNLTDITLAHVTKILEPIWHVKTETASRLRGRIEIILGWGKAHGYRTGDNPAQWKGNLEMLLPTPSKIAKVDNHKAIDWQDCPSFMMRLRNSDTVGARALEFLILTNTRSGECRLATWSEINMQEGIWTIPAERMKAEKEHRIPLSPRTMEILKAQKLIQSSNLIFEGRGGRPYSDMSLTAIIRRMEYDFTVHGFRSTFRTWAGETTAFPREVIEHAMAHKLKDKVEAAYMRGDLFTKRKALMAAWTQYLSVERSKEENVMPIQMKEVKYG